MKQCTCYALRAIDCTCKPAKYGELYTSPTAKQEQGEPVCDKDPQGCYSVRCHLGNKCKNTPQQRTWVGLTYEDMVSLQKDLHDSNGEIVLPTTFAKAVEAKLKEKNL